MEMNSEEFLRHIAEYDKLCEGCCYFLHITSQLAKEILERGDTGEDAIEKFVIENIKRMIAGRLIKEG
jgi:hypothetical protein